MCLRIYLAADTPQPTILWSRERPGLNIQELTFAELPVRRHFTKRHVYYVGSHTHCACGFRGNGTADAARERQAALEALADYVTMAAGGDGTVEMLACDEDELSTAPTRELDCTPDDLLALGDWVANRTLTRITIS